MADFHLIQIYWPGRVASRTELGRQLLSFLDALRPLHPGLGRFHAYDKRTRTASPADTLEACEAALQAGVVAWRTGRVDRTSYQQRFFAERREASPVAFELTCGIEPLGLDFAFTPNRLEFFVRTGVGDERASRAVLESVIRAAVAVYEPDYGYAGSERTPTAPTPVFSEGTPAVGWMTYFSNAFPAIPQTLPAPAVAYPVKSLGTLIVAHPELFDDRDPAQLAAVARVRDTLQAAGVLIPMTRLRRGR
jgi:hypothetical protein